MHVEGVLANNDYILNGCYIEITSNCNLRCIHCYNESGELRDQISVEAFKNVLGCYDNPKKASITLSGGEPLLHPQVWKFIDMMLDSGILARNILLITNATCITGDEAESNIRIDIPVPYSGVCPYVYQDENPVPISPRIATNGDVYLCQSFMDQRYCLGNINKDSLPHALFNENFINLVNFMTTGRFYMDDCNKCVLKYQCPRGCIGDCLANGSIHETDGGCFFRKENAIRQLLKQSEAIVAEHMQF